jgi:spore germination protein YaaH
LKKVLLYIGVVILVISIIYFGYIFFFINRNKVEIFSDDETKVVIGGDLIEGGSYSMVKNEETLFKVDFIKENIDPYILWDEKDKKLTVTTENKVIRMNTEELQAYVNNKAVKIEVPVQLEKDEAYVSIDFLKSFYGLEYEYIKDNNVIVIDYINEDEQYAKITADKAHIREGMSKREAIVETLEGGIIKDKVRIFEEEGKWYKVRAEDGAVGYIEKKYIEKTEKIEKEDTSENKKETKEDDSQEGKLSIAWHAIYSNTPDIPVNSKIDGLDVISPTWFEIKNKDGDLTSRANKDYVDSAHLKDYKIWALLANDFNSKEDTHEFLTSTTARENMIAQLLVYASTYALDGINIDFENLMDEDKKNLIQLVREMGPLLKEQGLIVSIDVNMAGNYNRKELIKSVDYMVLMAYDQHWAGGGKAGTVAGYSWVESSVKNLVESEKLPEEKLILGLPFYTRNWTVSSNSDGSESVVDVKAVSMEKGMLAVEDNEAKVVWDEEHAQFYAYYKNGDNTNKIWLEEQNSINWKSALVHKYNLAGTAAWKINYEVSPVWDVLYKNLKIINDYKEWEEKNADNVYELIISKKYTTD